MPEVLRMSEENVVFHCSPTLAGIKTGNLFSDSFGSREDFYASLRRINTSLVPKGVRMVPIRMTKDRALLYVYRPDALKKDFEQGEARGFLEGLGYPVENINRCIGELSRRVRNSDEFPHEVGLFLGYPPEDVMGFISSGAKGAKCVGTWKVYSDVESAKKRFALYEKCTRLYKQTYCRDRCFERLVVKPREIKN